MIPKNRHDLDGTDASCLKVDGVLRLYCMQHLTVCLLTFASTECPA